MRLRHDAVVFVMTRARTDFSNDVTLIIFLTIVFGVFMFLISVYGTIINRDNIRVGKLPRYVTLLSRKAPEGRRHILNFNLTVAAKVLPITLVGILAVTGFCYYLQSVNALSSIAYESNMAISEISVKLENNTAGREAAYGGLGGAAGFAVLVGAGAYTAFRVKRRETQAPTPSPVYYRNFSEEVRRREKDLLP